MIRTSLLAVVLAACAAHPEPFTPEPVFDDPAAVDPRQASALALTSADLELEIAERADALRTALPPGPWREGLVTNDDGPGSAGGPNPVTSPRLGRAVRIHGPSACDPVGGVNPYVGTAPAFPTVDEWVTLVGVPWHAPREVSPTLGQSNFPGAMSQVARVQTPEPETPAAWWIIGWRRAEDPIDWTPFGLPGCRLLVADPRFVLCHERPGRGPGWTPLDPDVRFAAWREGPLAYLRWRPDPAFAGRRMFAQFLVGAPGQTPGGLLVSHGVELWIGEWPGP